MKTNHPAMAAAWACISFVFATLFTIPIVAQQSYTYRFSTSPFTSTPSGGPELTPIGTTYTPVPVMIPASTCADALDLDLTHFETNSGFRAKAFFTSTYSIEMIFKFDELSSYARIIDFSNSQSDHGIYTHNDCLNFFPTGNIGLCPGAFDTTNYKQIVITRDNANKEMNVYVNGTAFTSHVDDTDYYVIGAAPNDSIKFFKDDLAFANEAAPGNVALIRMCDFVLSSEDVVDSYNSFCERITAVHADQDKPDILMYPNPVKDQLTIQFPGTDFAKEIELTIMNAIGQRFIQIPLYGEWIHIDMSDAIPGVYFYQLHVQQTLIKAGTFVHE